MRKFLTSKRSSLLVFYLGLLATDADANSLEHNTHTRSIEKNNQTSNIKPTSALFENSITSFRIGMAKTAPPKDLDGNTWKNSKAKKKLVEDLLTGYVPREAGKMWPRAVYDLEDRRELFHQFPYANFCTNLNTLRKAHLQMFSMAAKDLSTDVENLFGMDQKRSLPCVVM